MDDVRYDEWNITVLAISIAGTAPTNRSSVPVKGQVY